MATLALVGTGLIGGSAAWAMRRAGVFERVIACDLSLASAQKACEIGFADLATTSVEEAVRQADAVMVAVPVLAMGKVFETIARFLRPGTLITDVGSSRGSVIAAAQKAFGGHVTHYVPLHPIAGGEMPGIEYASPDLFQGCRTILTPHEKMDSAARDFWVSAWEKAGSRIVTMTPAEHDEIFAYVSHLPHVLAYTLVDAMAKTSDASRKFSLVGAGFRDFTRIAASSPAMWRDICIANRDALLKTLGEFEAELALVRKCIETGNTEELTEIFERASAARRTVGVRKKTAELAQEKQPQQTPDKNA